MLRTRRLILREARQGDLDDLFAIYSDPRAMRYWSTPPHPDASVTQGNLDRLIAASVDRLVYFVFEMQGRVIGVGGLHKGDEVGFLLHPDHWRQGLGREAMTAIIPHLFATTDLAQLTADADPRNAASIGLLGDLGFVETHRAKDTFCIDGIWSDSVYFALPRPVLPR